MSLLRRKGGGGTGRSITGSSAAWPGKRTLTQQGQAGAAGVTDKPTTLIVDRDPEPEQMLKAQFLEQLHSATLAAAAAELAPSPASDCPYLEQYFAKYTKGTAADVSVVISRFAPATRGAQNAQDLIAPIVARIVEGIRNWKATRKLPADVEAAAPGAVAANDKLTLGSLEGQLGQGQRLDASTAGRISGAVGPGAQNARIHTGPEAARMAADVDARAFAVGDNVVFGAGAYQPGTVTGDALLAHELAHVAQQSGAAQDPAARKKPIGDEAQGAELAADSVAAKALAAVHGKTERKSTWDDVLSTGLQLQRCPGNNMPDGPPMAGKEADLKIGQVPLISELIQNDIQRGFTGEKLVHLYDKREDYVHALETEVGLFRMIPAEQRHQVTEQFAETAKGITDPTTRQVYIYTQGTPAFVTIHELMHVHTSVEHLSGNMGLGQHFVEGAADYFTKMVCDRTGVPFFAAYAKEFKAVEALAAAIGDPELAHLTFHGKADGARAIVDSKGKGTWDAYAKRLRSNDYADASALLTGVPEANEQRVAKETAQNTADAAKAEANERAAHDAATTEERKTWPAEKTSPRSARMIKRDVAGNKTRLTLGAGGVHGIRETWTARINLKQGKPIDLKILRLDSRTTVVEIDSKLVPSIVEPIELRPSAP